MQKIHCSQPPPSGLIIQAFYDYAHSAESKRPTPINCLVHHLYRACPRVSDLSLAASRPALVPGKLMPRKVTPQRGISFFLSLDCFGVTAWRPEELPHMCAVSVFRSCGGTVNQVHDTSYSASHVLFLECLSSVPLRTSTYLPLTP